MPLTLSLSNGDTHALRFFDNWDGEGSEVFIFAFLADGEFFDFDNGKPVIECEGDEILSVWPLD